MTDCWVNWKGDFERFDPADFILDFGISWPDRVVWLAIDREKVPPPKWSSLRNKCPVFRLAFNGAHYYARKTMFEERRGQVRAELLDNVPDKVE